MDTVTYPHASMKDLAERFTCVRVKFDDAPDLVKQYGVGPLPDLRFLDADGKQVAKLVGFVPPSRLVTEAQAALDRIAGKQTGAAVDTPRGPAVSVEATPERVAAAVKKGVAFLRDARRKGFDAAPSGFAADDLVLLALVSSGLDAADSDVAALLDAAAKTPPAGTYQAAIRAVALGRLARPANRAELATCAKFLVDHQLANGQWSYATAGPAAAVVGDNSNTAYAVLGLAACRRAGIDVPDAVFEKAAAWWRSTVNADGGWGYRTDREMASYASMTESGASSLLLCRAAIGKSAEKDAVIDRAVAWVAERFSVSENAKSAYQQGRLLYHLYALERLGSLSGAAKIGTHDWYAESAGFLLGTQRADGSWDDGADAPVSNTCFALLVLTRSTAPLR
jgi:hypothetical protein